MNKMPLVSIVVCSYKEEKYIEDCLNSILDQEYPEIEVIVANDCSDDNTFGIAQKWVNLHKDKFVRCEAYKNKSNIGISKNFNGLIKAAKGDYIKPIAADDMLLPDAVIREVNYLEANKECDIVYADAIMIGENDKYPVGREQNSKTYYNNIYFAKPKVGKELTKELIENCFVCAPTVMYRKETFKKYGLYREDLAYEDWEYWLRLTSNGGTIGFIDDTMVAYRVRTGSNSRLGKGKESELRYQQNVKTEEIILGEYSEFVTQEVINAFWNRVVYSCILNNYKETLAEILKGKKFKKNVRTRCMIILYKMNVFAFFQSIWHKVNKR